MDFNKLQIKISHWLVKHRVMFFIFSVLCIALLAVNIKSLRFESSVESFFMPQDEHLENYHNFKKEFGNDNKLILALEFSNIFKNESFNLIESISEKIASIENVNSVESIATTKDILITHSGFNLKKLEIPASDEEQLIFKERILSDSVFKNNLVSEDGKLAIFRVSLVNPENHALHRKVVKEIEKIVRNSSIQNKNSYFFSNTLLTIQLLDDIKADLMRFLPLTFLVLTIILFLCFYDLAGLLIPLITVFLCVLCLGGLLGFFNIPINLVTVALPSIMLCISSLDCIHIFTSFRRYYFQTKSLNDSIASSIYENLNPCFFTTITTAIGFASMSISEVAPIKYFGRMACLSSFTAFFICFSCMPFLMSLIQTKVPDKKRKEINLTCFYKYSKTALIITAMLIPISFWGISKINIETSVINYIKNDRKIKKDTLFVKNHIAGVTSLELVVDSGKKNGVKSPKFLRLIDLLEKQIQTKKDVKKIISFNTYIKKINKALNLNKDEHYAIPNTSKEISEYILAYSSFGKDNKLRKYVDYDYQKIRLQIRILPLNSSSINANIKEIEKLSQNLFQKKYNFKITSLAYLESRLIEKITTGQMYSIAIAFFIVLLIVSLKYSSWIVGLFSLIPNGLPILIVLGIMGFLNIPLSASTSMISAIAFGLIVDDTLYFLHYFAKFSKKSADKNKTIDEVVEKAGRALLYTSSILSFGFLILFFSQSQIIKDFGVLISLTIVIAFIFDITVLPILLLIIPQLRRELIKKKSG